MFIYERARLAAVWRPTFLAASCLLIVSMLAGVGAVKALRLPDNHAFGGSISFPVRNIGLALANLALEQKKNGELLMAMNAKLNNLVAKEVGEDVGQMLPGGVDGHWVATDAVKDV